MGFGILRGAFDTAPARRASLPAGPRIAITAVTQPLPNEPQMVLLDQPILRDGLQACGSGRIQVTLAAQARRMPAPKPPCATPPCWG